MCIRDSSRQEIVDHAENVLQMRTDAVATEARQALQAKQSQIESIEEHALHYIHVNEATAQGEIMQKDMDLQRQTQDILVMQREISRLESQVNDSSMNVQNSSISEHQLQRMMMQEAESFSYQKHEVTQEREHWKREALLSQSLQRENLAKYQTAEQELKRKEEAMKAASAGGDASLQQQIEDQMDEIQGLLDESEGRRLSGVHKDSKNTELTLSLIHISEPTRLV